MFGPSSPSFSPNLHPQGTETGKLPLPKSSGIKGWQGDPGKLPTQAGDTRQRLRILLASQGFLAMGCDMGHFLKTQHPCRGNPQDTWGPECGGLIREPGRGCKAGPGKWGQSGRCVCVRGVRAARAPGRRVNGRVSRVCAHAGRACGARCDTQCMEWPSRGRAPGVRCAGLACASAARVCDPRGCADERGAWSPGVPGAGRGHCVHLREGRVLTPAPRRGHRSRSGSGLGSGLGSRLPAGLPQRARTGAKPGRRRRSHACSVSPRPPGRSAARAGGSAGPGRQSRAAPQSGHAPRSPPRAPSRSPARSLFKVTNPSALSAPGSCAALPGSEPRIPKRSPDPRGVVRGRSQPLTPWPRMSGDGGLGTCSPRVSRGWRSIGHGVSRPGF